MPTKFTDKFGEVNSQFESDGALLSIKLRNYVFTGRNFDSLSLEDENLENPDLFSFNEFNSITDCIFKIKIPIRLKDSDKFIEGDLHLGIIIENGTFPQSNEFYLKVNNIIYDFQKDRDREFWIDAQLPYLQKVLPTGLKIQSCLFCAYSNYWVAGSDSFGSLICFKDIKDKIVNINSKDSFMKVAENNGISTQETFWCSEFEPIFPNQWQYKDSI